MCCAFGGDSVVVDLFQRRRSPWVSWIASRALIIDSLYRSEFRNVSLMSKENYLVTHCQILAGWPDSAVDAVTGLFSDPVTRWTPSEGIAGSASRFGAGPSRVAIRKLRVSARIAKRRSRHQSTRVKAFEAVLGWRFVVEVVHEPSKIGLNGVAYATSALVMQMEPWTLALCHVAVDRQRGETFACFAVPQILTVAPRLRSTRRQRGCERTFPVRVSA